MAVKTADIQAQKQLSDHELAIYNAELDRERRSTVVAYLLWWFFGIVGAHNFYIGKIGWGFLHIVLIVIGPAALIAGGVLEAETRIGPESNREAVGPIVFGALALATMVLLLLWDMVTLPVQIRRRENRLRRDLLSRLSPERANPFRATAQGKP